MNDLELVQKYVRDGSQDAFTQLTQRHINLVFSAARRMLRDSHLAQDVTQQVFTLLARKAGQLGQDTILSAWLYRAASHLAQEALRRESRRRQREQLAMETMQHASTEAAWQYIEPLLDEAMGQLSAADHDAIVLRFFENRSLQEVGAALGSSEDAAQKRVTRALERLRLTLARRGGTTSATALAAAITAGAIQSAPAGLATSVAASAITAAASGSLLSKLIILMPKIKIIGALTGAALSVSLIVLCQQNTALRQEVTALRAAATSVVPVGAAPPKAEPGLSHEQIQRFRKEHLELLSLRGRVAQLANELRQTKSPAPASDANPNESVLLSAALTNRITAGNTLVFGGWIRQGMRAYVLLTPTIGAGTNGQRQITVQSQILGAPENFWQQINWRPYTTQTRRSTLALELRPEDADLLRQAVKETKNGLLTMTSKATRGDGDHFGLGWSRNEEGGDDPKMLLGVDYYARIAPDGESVDLELSPSPIDSNTPIHSLLREK